ncbi:MAG: transglycosylase SLT domain-containing protein [Burkholderiaceae bacterium]|nr:transglycosylase SLT domain-containing protein [Burkholderiaceae bacterium]
MLLACVCRQALAEESNGAQPSAAAQPLILDQKLDGNLGPNDLALDGLVTEDVDLWGRIRKGFGIPDLDNPLVANQTAWYVARPDYIQRSTLRASHYLYHVVEELEKRNMPTELALLPFVESAFNPQAYSSAKAAGMWQFIPSTGLDFKLKQNMFKDDRRDVLASTDAALTYLQRLYDQFGDWQLALAAYNWGEGSVQRAVNKNRAAGLPTDFNSLSPHMPIETRNYVPKLQAVKNIIANPVRYDITLPPVDNAPYFVSVEKKRDIDVKIAAKLAELPLEEFQALNPQFNRPVITSDTPILLPESNADKFKENLANWGHALSSWTSHTITSAREKIETIATRFGTTPAVIREVNQIPPRTHLKVGSTILVPKSAANEATDIAPEVAEHATMAVEPDAPPFRRVYVRVGRRDTLSSIAARNRVSVAQLKSWNNLRQDRVAPGQSLQVQVPIRAAVHPANRAPAPVRRVAISHPVNRPVVHPAPKRAKVATAPAKPQKKHSA